MFLRNSRARGQGGDCGLRTATPLHLAGLGIQRVDACTRARGASGGTAVVPAPSLGLVLCGPELSLTDAAGAAVSLFEKVA
jgi:hypothetical protein